MNDKIELKLETTNGTMFRVYDKKIKRLILSNMNLIKIPAGLDQFSNLEFLDLRNNQIVVIENLENLTFLIELDLSFNKIVVIENLENLPKLKKLDLKNNKITNLSGLENVLGKTGLVIIYNNPLQFKKINVDDMKYKIKDFGTFLAIGCELLPKKLWPKYYKKIAQNYNLSESDIKKYYKYIKTLCVEE